MIVNWTSSWTGMILLENILLPNEWTITVDFDSSTEDPFQEQIAFERVRYIVEEAYNNSIFLNVENEWLGKMHDKIDVHKISLPEEPVDHVIAAASLSKFISVAEGRLEFFGVKISSRLLEGTSLELDMSDLTTFSWLSDNPIQKLTGEPAWFKRSNAGTTDIWIKGKKKQEIIRDMETWDKIQLTWEPVVANTNQTPAPIRTNVPLRGWKPKVIDGGKKNE